MSEPDLVMARATVHLPDGIRPGTTYRVDRSVPYVADAIAGGMLVLVEPTGEPVPESGVEAPSEPTTALLDTDEEATDDPTGGGQNP